MGGGLQAKVDLGWKIHYNCSSSKILSKLAKAKRGAYRIRRQNPERFLGNLKSSFIAFLWQSLTVAFLSLTILTKYPR
jgi:hypothetical protein